MKRLKITLIRLLMLAIIIANILMFNSITDILLFGVGFLFSWAFVNF